MKAINGGSRRGGVGGGGLMTSPPSRAFEEVIESAEICLRDEAQAEGVLRRGLRSGDRLLSSRLLRKERFVILSAERHCERHCGRH